MRIVSLKENKIRKDCTQISKIAFFLLINREELHFIDYKREIYIQKIEKWRDRERERERERERKKELFPLSVVLGFGGLEVY